MVAAACVVGYVIAGFVQIWWIVLAISLALLLTVLTIMKRLGRRKEAEGKQNV